MAATLPFQSLLIEGFRSQVVDNHDQPHKDQSAFGRLPFLFLSHFIRGLNCDLTNKLAIYSNFMGYKIARRQASQFLFATWSASPGIL
jgi:hypothetical protein